MNDFLTEAFGKATAETYYLIHQVIVSLGICLVGMLAGLILAWLLWGHCKPRAKSLQLKNEKLQAELEALRR